VPAHPVRDLHDAVARSQDPVIASTRPAATTSAEMQRMVEDVLEKLRPDGVSVLELGCGTGVLGVPVARRASRYVGVDVSSEAVAVLRERLPDAVIRCADATMHPLDELGKFDRVLVYATLHYVTSAAEGECLVRNALASLAPGGRAFFGNLPLPGKDLPHSPLQRIAGLAWSGSRRLKRRPRREPIGGLPAGYCTELNRALINGWLRNVPDIQWRWLAPRVGVPHQRTRADLVVDKDASADA
jgi:SAM-dependent methyltransferase